MDILFAVIFILLLLLLVGLVAGCERLRLRGAPREKMPSAGQGAAQSAGSR